MVTYTTVSAETEGISRQCHTTIFLRVKAKQIILNNLNHTKKGPYIKVNCLWFD